MLINCPECELQISTKAAFCPHCGYVVSSKPIRLSTKRKRLPNGFGQISEIKGRNLRNPYRVMVPAGKDENGRPISKLLKPKAYFKTYNEAYIALVEYNKSPYDPGRDLTFEDLYEEWFEYHKNNITSKNTLRQYNASFAFLKPLHKYSMSQIKTFTLREAIEGSNANDPQKERLKVLCNMMYDYAVEREIVQRNYARELKLHLAPAKPSTKHSTYTEDEMKLLWENITKPEIFAQLLQCYTGFRPQEVLNIKLTDIDLDQMSIVGGIKTDAGINRLVPIHPMLYDLIREKYNKALEEGYTYLINGIGRDKGQTKPVFYDSYKYRFELFWENSEKKHYLHDGRVHFVTLAKKYNLNEYAIKYIVGHKILDITESVYTRRDIEWLKSEISKIPTGEFFGLKK